MKSFPVTARAHLFRRTTRHSGITLVELLMSLTICTILMVSLGSALNLTLRSALPSNNSPVLAHVRTAEVANRVLSDLTIAQSFSVNTATDVEFTVPSRDGDTHPATIRYQWSGSPSNQLLRSYNGGALTLFAADVEQFQLSYLTRPMGPPPPPPPVESSEYIVMQHDDAPGGSFSDFGTSGSNWCAQWVNPSLSPDTIAWKITRVEFVAKRDTGGSKTFEIQIRTADPITKSPTATILSTLVKDTADLPTTYAWVSADIPDVAYLTPEIGYCVVIAVNESASKYPKIQHEKDGTPMLSRAHWMTTSNKGSSWSTPEDTRDMRFRIYGTITTQPL